MSSPGMIPTRIAEYEVMGLLGRGGMGEVFEARDTQLGRSVALKLLPAGFAADPALVSRFQREARALAALSHPHIATLYRFEPGPPPALTYLVMELVGGETLAERLARGPIPPREALALAHQIALALEAAHEHGIIHRDIKPANIKITPEGAIKVLDFGLARAVVPDPSEAATVVETGTQAGAILGTPAYMSPEQARGASTDARSDIFAFGCVFYEMLAGRRAFAAPTRSDMLAAVLTREPDLTALPPGLSSRLLDCLRRCLAKTPRERWQAAGDLRYELEALQREFAAPPAAAPVQRRGRRLLPAALAAALAAAIAVFATLRLRPHPAAPAPVRFSFDLAAGTIPTATKPLAISADGSMVAYTTSQTLYIRHIGQEGVQIVAGAMGARFPVFSPDGDWIAFWSNATNELQKVDLGTGLTVPLAPMSTPSGLSWDNAGQIMAGTGAVGDILAIPARGGSPRTLIATGADIGEPQMLPDGKHILYSRSEPPFTVATAQIVVQSVRGGPATVIVQGAFDARYLGASRQGTLVYAVGSSFMQASFDPVTLAVGPPLPLLQGMAWSNDTTSAYADFAVARDGTLAWIAGAAQDADDSVALSSSTAPRKVVTLPASLYVDAVVSPDGRQLALQHALPSGNYAIDVAPFSLAPVLRRLTYAGSSGMPVWSPDGRFIAFESTQGNGRQGLWVQPANGSAPARRLSTAPTGEVTAPDSWSPDGHTILFSRHLNSLNIGIWSIPAAGGTPKLLVPAHPHAGRATFSTDGRWFAYFSDETGQAEVWVQPFPPTGAKYEVTSGGGNDPRWSSDGKRLYYLAGHGDAPVLTAVDVHFAPAFSAGPPLPMPAVSAGWDTAGERAFDPLPSGDAFIATVPIGAAAPNVIHVALNFIRPAAH
ncbi:MAG: protein kinase domain-containing protein [Terriglobales bacterium]